MTPVRYGPSSVEFVHSYLLTIVNDSLSSRDGQHAIVADKMICFN